VLAYELAQRGLEVLILEKATLPRYKACGGGLTRKTVQNLLCDVSPVFEREAAGGIISYGGRQLLKVDVRPTVAWLVMRDRFDHFLVQRAVEAGARLMDGLAVTGVEELGGQVVARTKKGQFAARLLAGADGVESVVARSVGLLPERQTGVAIEAEVIVSDAALEAQGAYATFDFGALPHGYGWIFPKRDHLSAGVGQIRPGKAVGLKRHLERFVESHAVLRGHHHLSLRGHRIPLGGRMETLHRGRVLLVGDAANLADPWLGEGVYYAVVSARMAAEAMGDVLGGAAADLSDYTARVNTGLVRQLGHGRRLARLVYRFPYLSSTALSRSPLMQDLVFSAVRGDLMFRQLNRALILQLPRILAQAVRGSGRGR
jgi:geranylgeranyl reductase family protein